MKENVKVGITGHVTVTRNGLKVLDYHNDIQTTAKEIIRRALGSSSHKLNKVVALNSGSVLASTLIPPAQITYPTDLPGVIKFRAIFDEASFNGNFNELRLNSESSTLGTEIFSVISFDPINKTSDNSLVIDWVLTIELI